MRYSLLLMRAYNHALSTLHQTQDYYRGIKRRRRFEGEPDNFVPSLYEHHAQQHELKKSKQSFIQHVVNLFRDATQQLQPSDTKTPYGCIIVFGAAGYKGFAPLKGSRHSGSHKLRQELAKHFTVFNLNEYNSSKLCSICHQRLQSTGKWSEKICSNQDCHNRYVDPLECSSVPCSSHMYYRIVDRDENACDNFLHIFLHLMLYGKRPPAFTHQPP